MRNKLHLLDRLLARGIVHAKGKGSDAPDPPDYAGAAAAQGAANKETALAEAALNRPTQVTPQGTLSWSLKPGADANNPKPGDWVSTQTLSPEQQQLYNLGTQSQIGLAQIGNRAVGQLGPQLGTQLDQTSLPSAVTTNIPTDASQFQGMANQARDSYYNQATRLYGEQFGQSEDALRTRLANQGITEGSEAYNREVNQFQRNRDLAYQNAADTATQRGFDLQTQQLNNLINAVGAQNTSRQAGIQQQSAMRQVPLNEIIAIMSGSQMQNPQFQSGNSGAQIAQAPTFDATQAQYQAQLGNYNAQSANRNMMFGGLAQLGAAGINAWG